ncbi:MAG: methylamine dehydrogenase accessory protein MauD [Deltaproteobacteria bacterium]|nr:methylamine dehydrogenase accessory protein MauD [Deltaproteobacteria bacterium]
MQALIITNVLLWVCVVALALVVFALSRQVGLLHERVAPAGALAPAKGPTVGQAAPRLSLTTLDGSSLELGAPSPDGRDTLLFFLSPTCPLCRTLLPTLLRVAADEDASARVVLAGDGDPDEYRRYAHDNGVSSLPLVVSTELGLAWQVSKLPYAALVDGDGLLRARGMVNTREHLESLFEARRLGVASVQEYLELESAALEPAGDELEEPAGGQAL